MGLGNRHMKPGQRTARHRVQVRHRGRWCPGTLRAWDTDPETGEQLGLVTWTPIPGEVRVSRFHEGEIRET